MTLQELRLSKGLSQSQLSALAGVSKRTLEAYESGARSMLKASGETLYKLSKALECTMEDLIRKETTNL